MVIRSISASEDGLDKAKVALAKRELNHNYVARHIHVTRTVVSNFFNRKPIREDNFISICNLLLLEWTEIREQQQTETTQNINSEKLSKNIELKRKSSEIAIASVKDVLSWGWNGHNLLDNLIQLDYETITNGLTEENEGDTEQWVPVFMEHPDTWRLLIDGSEKIVGYWHFVPLFDDDYQLAKQGLLLDGEITCDKVCYLELPGFYNIYFVLFTILPSYRGVHNFRLLFNSLIDRLTELAKENIFIKEICANAFTEHGMSLCKTLGMKLMCEHQDRGNVFIQSFCPLPDLEIFKPTFR